MPSATTINQANNITNISASELEFNYFLPITKSGSNHEKMQFCLQFLNVRLHTMKVSVEASNILKKFKYYGDFNIDRSTFIFLPLSFCIQLSHNKFNLHFLEFFITLIVISLIINMRP
jgi:hypothetical protein